MPRGGYIYPEVEGAIEPRAELRSRGGRLARGGRRDGVEGGVEVCDQVRERLDPHREPHLRSGLAIKYHPHLPNFETRDPEQARES